MAEKEKGQPITLEFGPQTPVEQVLESAPVLHIDGAVGFASAENLIRFNLYQDRLTVSPELGVEGTTPITRTVCARLSMSLKTLMVIHQWLGDHITQIQKDAAQSGATETPKDKDGTN